MNEKGPGYIFAGYGPRQRRRFFLYHATLDIRITGIPGWRGWKRPALSDLLVGALSRRIPLGHILGQYVRMCPGGCIDRIVVSTFRRNATGLAGRILRRIVHLLGLQQRDPANDPKRRLATGPVLCWYQRCGRPPGVVGGISLDGAVKNQDSDASPDCSIWRQMASLSSVMPNPETAEMK